MKTNHWKIYHQLSFSNLFHFEDLLALEWLVEIIDLEFLYSLHFVKISILLIWKDEWLKEEKNKRYHVKVKERDHKLTISQSSLINQSQSINNKPFYPPFVLIHFLVLTTLSLLLFFSSLQPNYRPLALYIVFRNQWRRWDEYFNHLYHLILSQQPSHRQPSLILSHLHSNQSLLVHLVLKMVFIISQSHPLLILFIDKKWDGNMRW